MSASPASVRRVVALALGVDLAAAPLLASRFAPPDMADPFVNLATSLPGVALAAVGVVCAVMFGRGRLLYALGALVISAVLQEGVGRASGIYFEPAHVTGVVTVGYLLGHAVARFAGGSPARFAGQGAVVGIAAVYVSAGLSKLLASGVAWGADPVVVRAMVAAHHDVGAGPLRAAISDFVVGSPAVGAAMALGALVVEAGSFVLLVGPRARRAWSLGLLVFHAVLFWLTGILFIEGAAVLFVVGGWGEPIARRLRARPAAAIYGVLVFVVALVWGATRPQVGDLPGPAMIGLLGAWLSIEALASPDAPEDAPPVDPRRLRLALAAWMALASLAWLLPVEPRGHPLDESVSIESNSPRRTYG